MRNAKVATLGDGGGAVAEAVAARGERFAAVGGEAEVMRLTGEGTGVVDAGGLRVIPGLNDSHLHAIRGGLHFNLELRWDGVDSLARGLEMIREQADRTPQGQWTRVMGGWWRGRSTRSRYGAPTGAKVRARFTKTDQSADATEQSSCIAKDSIGVQGKCAPTGGSARGYHEPRTSLTAEESPATVRRDSRPGCIFIHRLRRRELTILPR